MKETPTETPPPVKRRVRMGNFIDRHATILTILAMAVLVLVPTKIAYDASGNATDAGDTATHAAHKASNAVTRLEDERRQRIYDQNGIDRYFCGKSVAIERVLTLLLTASLGAHKPSELTTAQLEARAVFEAVLSELGEAPKCEVLIPKPPKPKPGEHGSEGAQAEAHAEAHPEETQPFTEPPPPSSGHATEPHHQPPTTGGGEGGGTSGHHTKKPPPPDTEPEAAAPAPSHAEEANAAPTTTAPAQEAPPAETTKPTETTTPPAKSGLVPGAIESVEGVITCLGKSDLACTLGEVVGQP